MLQPRRSAAEVQVKVLQTGESADDQKALAGEHITALQVEGSEPSETCKQCKVEVAKHDTLHILQPLPCVQELMAFLQMRDCKPNMCAAYCVTLHVLQQLLVVQRPMAGKRLQCARYKATTETQLICMHTQVLQYAASADGSHTCVLLAHLRELKTSLWVRDENQGTVKGTLQRYHAPICQLDAAAQVQIDQRSLML